MAMSRPWGSACREDKRTNKKTGVESHLSEKGGFPKVVTGPSGCSESGPPVATNPNPLDWLKVSGVFFPPPSLFLLPFHRCWQPGAN